MGEPTSDRIAIVGMGGVFPGAPTLDVLWQNVCDGVDAITDVPPGRWDPVFYDPAAAPGRTPTGPGPGGATATATVAAPARVDRFYCRRGGFVDDVAHFDPTAFGIMPIVVAGGEPDQFLALAQAAAALDDAGGVHERVAPDRIGVVVGRGGYRTPGIARLDQRIHTVQQLVEGLRALVPQIDDARLDQVRHEFVRQLGPDRPEASIGLVPNLAASRIANRFDFQGPAFTVDAACASALVAIDHGLHELTRRRCDLVVAGGAHHCHDVTLWSVFTQLKALSPSQGIRPFSRRADGILIGEGTGFFVLKRLADAERDGDRVYAVVCGSGIASDGRSTSLMSPNPSGQVLAIERAWQAAGFDPATVGLIEAHGTGTPAGDEAELDSLRKVFGSPDFDQRRAGLGSIKSMIGHAMPAAGAAGLAKATLALHHGVLPPTLHVEEPHPLVEETRFRLVTEAEPWTTTGPRRAGVNAFGFGGINAHLVLEEHGAARSQPTTRADRRGRASTAPSSVAGARRHDTTNGRTAPAPGPSARTSNDPGPTARAGSEPDTLGAFSDEPTARADTAPDTLGTLGTESGTSPTARSNDAPGTTSGRGSVTTAHTSNGPGTAPSPGTATGPAERTGRDFDRATGNNTRATSGPGTAARSGDATPSPGGSDTSLRSGTAGSTASGDDRGCGTTEATGTTGAQARGGADVVGDARGGTHAATTSPGTGPTGRATAMTGAGTMTRSGNVGHTAAGGAAVAARRGGTAVLPATLLLAESDPANLGRRLHEWVVAHDAATSAAPERPSAPPSITDVPERPGPARLAVVGVDARRLELAQKVVAQGQPWRGRNGVWFEPRGLLHDGGKVAFLFPGVEPTFDPRVDDVAAHFGLEPLAATLVDDRASARSPLERQSRGILAVGRLLDAVLGQLGIRPDMVAGHSLGEWSGELASGVIADDLFADVLERLQPGAIKVADVVFVALGCGADTAAGLLTGLDGTVVSHDNCTRQSVVCGPPGEISVVVDRCKARRVLAQELPFRSGFHSPLFAAHVPALRAALGSLPLRAPRIPLWSATTCRPYPDDVEGVRDLATRHLVEPVRFRQLTLALHDAGARVFVQVGVGNLTGFVDDTLHGRDAMTIAANSAKRSGLDQLCHVAAALWVQGRAVAFAPLASPPGEALRAGRTSAAVRPARASLLDLGTRLVRDLTPLDLAPPPPVSAEEEDGEVEEQEEEEVEVEAPAAATTAVAAAPAATAPAGLVTTRRLSLDEVPAWADHAFFRQRDGWPYGDDRFPLVPMTGIIEMLQQTANRLHPELVPVAVVDIAAFRWLTVDPPVEITLRATPVASEDGDPRGSVRVKAAIDGHARATVVLAPKYPARTPANAARLVNERPSHIEAQRFYIDRHMFHGPAYQGVRAFQAVGDNGSRAVLKSLAAPGALLDNAGQLMGHWLSAHAEVDRLVLPTSIGRVELYGPHPPPGTLVDCTVTITHLDDKVLRSDMLLTVDRRLWCKVTDWEDRRFATDALVFETLQWPERAGMSVERGPYALLDERWPDSATRDVVMRRYLSRPERAEYDRHHPLGQRAFLLGRIAVKDVVRRWLWARRRGPLYPAEILVANEAGGRPLVRGPFTDDLRVSLAHVEGRAVAIVAEGVDVGIDVERVEPRRPTFENLVLTPAEQRLALPEGYDRDAWLTAVWAVKEAAAKATGRGLGGRPKDFEIVERRDGTALVGDRLVAFERLPGASTNTGTASPTAAQKEHIVAWTVIDR